MSTSAAGRPSWLLTGSEGYLGDHVNESTAMGLTSKQLSIHATFFPNRPPQPSKLCVHCPGAKDIEDPRVLCVAGDLILFRVNTADGSLPLLRPSSPAWREYFVYRAEPSRTMLKLLPVRPAIATFNDSEVGILPRGNDDFTVAALGPFLHCLGDKFDLRLLHSNAWSWTSIKVSVAGPPKKFPINLENSTVNLSGHMTTSVVIIGGEYGTIGWVDLWRGVLLCDVLSEKPTLRSMPVPLPMDRIFGNDGRGFDFGRGKDCRGVAFVNGCLKFVELGSVTEFMHIVDEETGMPTLIVHDWAITTYSNSKMSCSYEDWQEDGMVQSSNVKINNDNPMVSHTTGGLLLLPSHREQSETAATSVVLQKLVVSDPSPSLSGDGVVYLVARVKFGHPKSWLIAIY